MINRVFYDGRVGQPTLNRCPSHVVKNLAVTLLVSDLNHPIIQGTITEHRFQFFAWNLVPIFDSTTLGYLSEFFFRDRFEINHFI